MQVEQAIIGGTGLYQLKELTIREELDIETPWGKPSAPIVIGEIEGVNIAFLARHGKGHQIAAHEVNYQANIAALKHIGVKEIIAFSAAGSLKEELRPMDFVIPNQIIDRTRRTATMFGDGVVAHVGFADPFCPRLSEILYNTINKLGFVVHKDETLIVMQGPMFSTRAESNLYRSWGAGLINMSTIPEAKLAREAEICYALVAMITDYDCWHETEDDVSVTSVLEVLSRNAENAREIIKHVVSEFGKERNCVCANAAATALVSNPEYFTEKGLEKVKYILPQYVK